jgi:hypothetical protein
MTQRDGELRDRGSSFSLRERYLFRQPRQLPSIDARKFAMGV